MTDIKKVKEWLQHKGITPEVEKNTPQFDIVFEDPEGIKSVKRIKDQKVFEINLDYPALRGDFFKFEHFDQNRVNIKYKVIIDGETLGVGHCPINDIIVKNGFLADERMEKTITELAAQGIKVGKFQQVKIEKNNE